MAFTRDLAGLHVLFLGPLLRSAVSFQQLAALLGVRVSQHAVTMAERTSCQAALRTADVIYIQSLSDVVYDAPDLNSGRQGPALPPWMIDAITESGAPVMHALPRGPELPDSLMWGESSLVAQQVEHGLPVRSAILRWLIEPT
jgi:aspartate carbamoyltransferase catalytic subunit